MEDRPLHTSELESSALHSLDPQAGSSLIRSQLARINTLTREVKEKELRISQLQDKAAMVESLRQENDQLRSQVQLFAQKVEQAEQDAFAKTKALIDSEQALRPSMQRYQLENEEVRIKASSLSEQLRLSQQELDNRDSIIVQLRRELTAKESLLDLKLQEASSFEGQVQSLKAWVARQQDHAGRNSQVLGEKGKLISELELSNAKLREEVERTRKQLKEANEELSFIPKLRHELRQCEFLISTASKELDREKTDRSALVQENAALQEEIQSLKQQVGTKGEQAALLKGLQSRLWKSDSTDDDELVDLTCEVKNFDLQTVLKPNLQVEVHSFVESDRAVLYKFFGGLKQAGVFEARTETFSRMIPATWKFAHNSSSCMSNSGLIYLTGGSLTGRSRNDAAVFNPQTGQVSILQSMLTHRRSHASICSNNACYVFGGLMEDDRCSLCEKFTEGQDSWASINNMQERRAYLGCCLFQSQVYLCGGSATPSCEIFNPSSESFELLPLHESGLEDNCCLAALDDSLLIFYGSYQGRVLRYYPESGDVRRLKDMCYGNSWSSCAPVVYQRIVYMLRSESVFKYNTDTEESAYVMRMSKSAQRGQDL